MSKKLEELKVGAISIIPEEELAKKLRGTKKLTVKLGADPTAPDLHLGHAVVLKKMKQLQDMGHNIIFLIGDFTARIGDPSGKSKTRPPLTKAEIEENTQSYFKQVSRILDMNKVTIRYNSEWLEKLTMQDMLALCSKITVARLIEREDFANRLKNKQPIGFHELLYPLMQGYDSVILEADIELGGTDQTFNLLMGRFLQEQYGQKPQAIITTPLLEGLDGVQKMSKSLDNYVGLTELAGQAFGKLMSISDECMWRYFEVLLNKSTIDITSLKKAHPMETKKQMAHEIISSFWSIQEADDAKKQFEEVFQKKDLSKATAITLPNDTKNPLWIVNLLKLLGAVKTSSEAKRLIESRSVLCNGDVIKDFKAEIIWQKKMTIKVGKHRIYILN